MTTQDHQPESTVRLLTQAGFTVMEAHIWARQGLDPATALESARTWRAHGFRDGDATSWRRAGWNPASAAAWRQHGFTERQATYVRACLQPTVHTNPTSTSDPAAPDTWLQSGLTADDIVLTVTAGCRTIPCARQLATEIDADPKLRGTLRLRADLDGIDLRAMKGNR